ncbi:MAG: methionyl-tRNA formyltransferase [Bacteroidales bacterium]|nr:methionyl-tRNA formyltransferase [Bacteroidales bacterium]
MKRLDRFILTSFIGPFIAILFVVVFILMMQFLWLYIDELVGKGLGMKVILEFLMWGTCTILPLALPLSTLLASMMVMGSLGENKELMAIKASGVSLGRVMMPLMIASALISVAAFYAGNNLVPRAYNEIYTLRDDIGRTKEEIKIPSGTFYDGIDGYILRVQDQDDESGMMYGVMVYDHTTGKGNTSLTIADSSLLKMSRNKDYLTFTLFNGSNYQETNVRKYRDTTLELQRVDFAKQELIIPLKNYAFEKSDSSRFGDQIKSMRVSQLLHEQDSLRGLTTEALDRHYKQMNRSGSFMMRKQLDTAVHSGASRMFEYEGFGKWKTLDDKIEACRKASNNASRMSTELTSCSHEVFEYLFFLRRTDVEILKKFAQALACFILFFIGAPLGALIRKGGLGTSAIISVLFFVLYWVVDISGTKLARDGAVSATTGAFISAYVLAPIGIFLTWKAVNDSALFENDQLKSWWRKVKSMVSRFFKPVRIVYMGTPEFAVAPLDAIVKAGYKVVGVVTVADKPSGRGLKVNESAVKKYAVEHGIPVLQPVKLKDPEFLSALKAWKADMFVVVAFRMLPEEVWAMPRLGTFNLHAALLPQYRGAAPINWAVINGERMTGVTTFMIDKDIDTGGIILRQEHVIGPNDTAGDVHDALMDLGAKLVVETVEGIIQKNVETRVQRSFIQGSEVLKPAPKLTRELCHIDWSDTTANVVNLIRGLSPYPTAFTELVRDGEAPVQLKIFKGAARHDLPAAAPGTVLSDGRSYMAIATADGAVAIEDLQLAGKKRMEVKAFLAGFRNPGSYSCTEGTSKKECGRA